MPPASSLPCRRARGHRRRLRPATAAEQWEHADVVFTGTLVSREVLRPDPRSFGSDDPAVHVFAVDTVLEGAPSDLAEEVQALTGTGGPGGPMGPGAAGDPVVLLYEDPSPVTVLLWVAGLAGVPLLAGALAAFEGRRADRRALRVVVLTRD